MDAFSKQKKILTEKNSQNTFSRKPYIYLISRLAKALDFGKRCSQQIQSENIPILILMGLSSDDFAESFRRVAVGPPVAEAVGSQVKEAVGSPVTEAVGAPVTEAGMRKIKRHNSGGHRGCEKDAKRNETDTKRKQKEAERQQNYTNMSQKDV